MEDDLRASRLVDQLRWLLSKGGFRLRWQDWLEKLPELEKFAMERCFKPLYPANYTSSQMYRKNVTHLRLVNEHWKVHCGFLIGKSRQTPPKSVTIPRLEPSAAVVATRLNKMMRCK